MMVKYPKQSGFSMIELMIAMLLGMLLIAGLIGVFIASNNNYRTSNSLNEIQDKSRFTLKTIRRDVSEAGFLALGASAAGVVPVQLGDNLCSLAGQADVLRLNSPGLATTQRCYFLQGTTLRRKQTISGVVSTVDIIDGVQDSAYLFALDTNNDGSIDADGTGVVYFARANVSDWSLVRAIKLDVLIMSDTGNVVDQAQILAAPTPFANVDYGSGAGVMPDNRLYQVFSAVFAVRNRVN